MTSDPVDQLATALDATEHVITAVRDEQWSAPTPCPEWTVRDLVGHMVTSNHAFVRILSGAPAQAPGSTPPEAPAGGSADGSPPDGGLVEAYRDSAVALLAAFRQPGVLDRVHTVPIGPVPGIAALHLRITEVLVHGWDSGPRHRAARRVSGGSRRAGTRVQPPQARRHPGGPHSVRAAAARARRRLGDRPARRLARPERERLTALGNNVHIFASICP